MGRNHDQISAPADKNLGRSFMDVPARAVSSSSNPILGYSYPASSGVDVAARAISNSSNPNPGYSHPASSGADVAARAISSSSNPNPGYSHPASSGVDVAARAISSSSYPIPGYSYPASSGVDVDAVPWLSRGDEITWALNQLKIGGPSRITPAFTDSFASGGFDPRNTSDIDWTVRRNLFVRAQNMPRSIEDEEYTLQARMRARAQAMGQVGFSNPPQNHRAIDQFDYFNPSGGTASFHGRNSNGGLSLYHYPTYPNGAYPSYGRRTHLNPSYSYWYPQNDLRLSPRSAQLDAASEGKLLFLRKQLLQRNPAIITEIFYEIKIRDLMVDQYGNSFIQDFFAVCTKEQMGWLLSNVICEERKLLEICANPLGSKVIQKMLENLKSLPQRSMALDVLRRLTRNLSKGMNSHHVIKHCLMYFTNEETKHIQLVLANNCLDLAMDKYGCVVLQDFAQYTHGEHRERLLAELAANALVLSEHPFGNYVVSLLVEKVRIPDVTAEILSQLRGRYVSLSMNKHASNVIEKCLREAQGDQQAQIIMEIMNDHNFLRVLQNSYGNFVAQTALQVCTDRMYNELVKRIHYHDPSLKSHLYGKRVLDALKGRLRRA